MKSFYLIQRITTVTLAQITMTAVFFGANIVAAQSPPLEDKLRALKQTRLLTSRGSHNPPGRKPKRSLSRALAKSYGARLRGATYPAAGNVRLMARKGTQAHTVVPWFRCETIESSPFTDFSRSCMLVIPSPRPIVAFS
jgi:hypothetical protein